MTSNAVTFDERAWRESVESNRTRVRQWILEGPTSYFAAVARTDFGSQTSLVVGSAEDAQVRIDDESVRPHHLRVTVVDDSFRVEALDAEATFSTKDGPQREALVGPSSLRIGRFSLRLSHQGFPAIVVFDPERLKSPPPLEPQWWPIEPSLRVIATLVEAEKPEEVVIQSTRGHNRRGLKLGHFEFEVGGEKQRLEATRLLEPGVDDSAVSLFFRDATTGKGSYPVGRYLDPRRLDDGRWVLDFNRAYNPACAFSPHYNCPIPPRANRLGVAIEAGEKSPKER